MRWKRNQYITPTFPLNLEENYSYIMQFLVKIILYKILVIFIFFHLCYSYITQFFLGNKKHINGELSVFPIGNSFSVPDN